MPRAGGEADKLGNRYESLWTVDAALDLIDGDYTDLTVEAVGDEAAGVEFFRTTPAGVREYHSIKRQQGDGNWTIAKLTGTGPTGRSILGDLFAKAREGNDAVFSSGTSATNLEELTDHARASNSFDVFKQRIGQNAKLSAWFGDPVAPLVGGERAAWEALRRLRVRTKNESTLRVDVERRARSMFRTADGGPVNPRAVELLMADELTDSLGKRHTAESVLGALAQHGIVRSLLAGDRTVLKQIKSLNGAHVDEVRALLINRRQIEREESRAAEAALLEGGKSVMVEGAAGSGKSCVVAQVLERLETRGVPSVAVRLDRLGDDVSAQAIGTRRGLPESPAITLGEVAGGKPSVLVLDQLDAISVVSARNQEAWGAFNELLEEARAYPEMRVLFACRSFDLERDPRLRAVAEERDAEGHDRVERIAVGPLGEDAIRSAVAAAGRDPGALNETQMEILATPLHLHLFLEAPAPGTPNFVTARDLFDAFWDRKASDVADHFGGRSSTWTGAIESLCDALSEREATAAPSYVLDGNAEVRDALASEGVVSLRDGSVSFFHESFFDYAFARMFVRSGRDVAEWLLSGEQHLFRRSQVRQVLGFLRGHASDRPRYLRTLRDLLDGAGIRFHIKKLVLDWLGSLPDPRPYEWMVVEGIEPELGGHAWEVVHASVAWFDTLHELGRWKSWLAAEDEQADRAVTLLRVPNVIEARSAEIARLVRPFRHTPGEWPARLRWVVSGGWGYTSPEMHDLVIDLMGDGTLDDARPGFAVNDDWWSTWYGLGTKQPSFAVRLLGAWFDRQVARAAELRHPDPFAYELDLVVKSQYSGTLIRECSEAEPRGFAQEFFPRLARLDLDAPRTFLAAPVNWDPPGDQLREVLARAMCAVAQEAPDALDAIIESEAHGDSKWMSALLLRAWSANPEVYADRIVAFLLKAPQERMRIGYDIAGGGVDAFAAISRAAVAAASSACSDESFADLEQALIGFAPEWEWKERLVGRTALALLRAMNEGRLSATGRRRVRELDRRFPEAEERGSPVPPSGAELAAQLVGPPIERDDQRLMTDGQWLAAMARHASDRGDWTRDDRMVGGAIELARGLPPLVRDDPERFSRLAGRMGANLHPAYFRAILDGLTAHDGSARAGSLDQICFVLRRIAEIGAPGLEKEIADAIGALADEAIPDDIIAMLRSIAESAADPEADTWPVNHPSDPVNGPATQAINSARGAAARSAASLLFANRDRWEVLRPTVERFMADPVLAVRSVAVRCLLAVLDTHREAALAGFERLAEGADLILGSGHVERFIHYAVFRDYAAMRPTLLAMLGSTEAAAVRTAARQMTLAALSMDEAREDASLVLRAGKDARVGAATVYAQNVADATVGAECEEWLKVLFHDVNAEVRREAATCWNALEPDELARRGSLIGAFIASVGPDVDVGHLAHSLGQAREPLPAEVCDLAERAVAAYGSKGADVRRGEAATAHALAPLVLRLHEETDDPELRRRVLDVIDDMLRAGFMGMADRIEEQYAR